ncbi:hypothetical protein ACFL0G_03015 [Candidatus Zixiibacteriota bacterium]
MKYAVTEDGDVFRVTDAEELNWEKFDWKSESWTQDFVAAEVFDTRFTSALEAESILSARAPRSKFKDL